MTCSLATITGRIELPFVVPAYAMQYVGQKVCSADLCYRKGRYSLHIIVTISAPSLNPTHEVVGVDLGLNRPAVTSSKQFLGSKRWKEQERRIFRLRRKLQAKGIKSSSRYLKKLSGQLFRQRRDHDHVLSKRIVQHTSPGSTIVLENLTNIRETSKLGHKETKRRLNSWSLAQLFSFIDYKAEAQGMRVVKIDPRHTNQPNL